MGNCFSDVAGGQQAVGGVQSRNALDWQSDVFEAVENLGGTRGLSSQIQLSFSANKLRVMDTFSKSDPMLVGFLKRFDGSLEELGRTEVVLNSSSPNWVKELRVEYRFEEVQQLLLRVYDIDTNFANISSEKLQLRDQQFLGEVVCALSEIVMAPNQKFTVPLHGQGERVHQHDWGSLTITTEEMVKSKSLVEIVVRCAELDNKDLFSKSDPFLRISRLQEDGSATSVYRTEVKKNNLNPTWKPIRISLQQLNNGDMDRPLKIECCNFNTNGSHDLIGVTQISLNGLLELTRTRLPQDLNRPVQNQNKQPGGKFYVESCVITPIDSFLDYVTGGCELNFMVAVDFTASNGNPLQPDSLHYFDPSGRSNAYQTAIRAVGQIIHHYDTDKRFPCWGFGGRPIDGPVSHCFALNGNNSNPVVDGIPGIMFAYSQALRNITLAGPTLFAPVINMAASIASQHVSQDNQKYFVLLIITDGVITDLQQTIIAIINAAELPLSLLIVGVGGADFTEMETLDADKKRLSGPDGRVAARDIVQFMPMRNVAPDGASIARSLLAELPGQLLEYMKSRGIVPGNRPLVQPHAFAS
ncbi:unnamed protein product [Sphagnum troendelagicum]|uniref:C2 domain-containing protein n=1 Tax=Sphagnum troendelagicum TaxID=128251 RepID=A0ABP0TU28_9BRYO